jgi:hypothetical protein
MRITQILKLLLLTGFLSGCWSLHIKGETPATLGNIDLLQSFIGQGSESVIRELGLPDELLSDGDKQFMVYSARSSDTAFLMIIWVPVWAGNSEANTLHCLRFELDSDNVVKEYRLKSKVLRRLLLGDQHFYSNCQEVFWIWKEPTKLQKATDFPSTWKEIEKQQNPERYAKWEKREPRKENRERRLKQAEEERQQQVEELFQQAKQGNADAQLALFKGIRAQNPKEALRWLCKSADQGNQDARHILGSIYEHDGHIWVDRYFARRDYQLAYMWYSLGGQMDGEMLHSFADRHLNSAELSEAKNMLREWTPGQCERDLGLVSLTE